MRAHNVSSKAVRRWIIPALACLSAAVCSTLSAQGTLLVRPVETDEVLVNPGMGFNTSLYLSRRPDSTGRYKISERKLGPDEYPSTSLAYLRFDWRYLEPEKGRYTWSIIDDGLKYARARGQTLMLRIVPYGNNPPEDIPDWLRAEIGESRDLPHSFWRVDHEDPRYVAGITALARELGKRYDGHPDLEFVDIGIVGFWGEGAGSELLSDSTRQRLVNAYLEAFHKTPLVMLLTDERTNKYGISRRNVGWRVDCLGDLGFWASEQGGWTHMNDYYPESIVDFGMRDAWKKSPVALEICGTFPTWKNREGYDAADVDYIIDQSLKWHISSCNGKSSPFPLEWKPQLERWLKSMGYRFVLRKFTCPSEVRPHGKLSFRTWWENKGVAPCYRAFPLALRLKNDIRSEVLLTDADITGWLPGDNIYDSAVFLPMDMPEGEYELQLGLLDPSSRKPKVKLAIEGLQPDGWYSLGQIRVKETLGK